MNSLNTTKFHMRPANYWKHRNNSILLDIDTYKFKVHNRTKGKIRIFLGKFDKQEFSITIPTIQIFNLEDQSKLRDIVKTIILDLVSEERRTTYVAAKPKPIYKLAKINQICYGVLQQR